MRAQLWILERLGERQDEVALTNAAWSPVFALANQSANVGWESEIGMQPLSGDGNQETSWQAVKQERSTPTRLLYAFISSAYSSTALDVSGGAPYTPQMAAYGTDSNAVAFAGQAWVLESRLWCPTSSNSR